MTYRHSIRNLRTRQFRFWILLDTPALPKYIAFMAIQGRYIYEWPRPMVTADAAVFRRPQSGRWEVLLIRRGQEPYKGSWCFPGGFLELDEEIENTAARELREETGLTGIPLEQVHTFGTVGRDPRGRVLTVLYAGLCDTSDASVCASDDAADARWFDINDLPELGFDHENLALHALKWLANRLEN